MSEELWPGVMWGKRTSLGASLECSEEMNVNAKCALGFVINDC